MKRPLYKYLEFSVTFIDNYWHEQGWQIKRSNMGTFLWSG